MTYDANGNLTKKQAANGNTLTYTWNARNQLAAMSGKQGDGTPITASFKYDALGRRIERTVNSNSVQYLYDGNNAIAELSGNAIDANILTGLNIDEVIARYTTQGERTLLTDALGSVILAAKENGTVQTAYGYSPYGEAQVMGTEEGNTSQYTARENDGTGLYYYRARYYDPQLKQWTSEDPIGLAGGTNLRMYVEGDPVSLVDPLGLSGHHFFPQSIWRGEPLPTEASRVFDRATTGPIPGGHNYGDGHSEYNKGVRELYEKWKAKNGIECKRMSAQQADDFIREIKTSRDPRIRDFNKRIYWKIVNGAVRRIPGGRGGSE